MLIGNVEYFLTTFGGGVGPMSHGGADTGVTAEYAQRASKGDASVYVRWSCANGDPRDVRWYREGVDVTDKVAADERTRGREKAQAELDKLTRPYGALDAVVQIRPAGDGRVSLILNGEARTYEPGEIRARGGLAPEEVAAYDEMRTRAIRIVALARESTIVHDGA